MTTRDLHAELLDFADLTGDLRGDRRVDAEGLLAHEGFAGKFEEDAGVGGPRRHETTIICVEQAQA